MIIIRLIVVHNTMKFGATQLICHEFSVNFHFLNHAHAIQFVGPLVKGDAYRPSQRNASISASVTKPLDAPLVRILAEAKSWARVRASSGVRPLA